MLPFLAAYFAHRRQLDTRRWVLMAAPFVLAALVVNLYPYDADSDTEILVALHLPVVLWFVVAYPYMGGTIRSHERRMDFVRFTGEWFIYYVLIALGGGVLMALTAAILEPTGVDVDRIAAWVLPSGAAGAVIVAAWLVESKQRVVENMAPVLTMLFTPLFAVMLACAAVVYAVTGFGGAFDRELLSVFDALLLVVLALVLYGMSAREPSTSPEWMDGIQLVAVVGALVLDLIVLGAMIARIGDLGFTPNRTAALGLNVVLLVNLAGAAWLSVRFLTDAAGSTGSSDGRRRTFPSSPCGPPPSWSSSRRSSLFPERSPSSLIHRRPCPCSPPPRRTRAKRRPVAATSTSDSDPTRDGRANRHRQWRRRVPVATTVHRRVTGGRRGHSIVWRQEAIRECDPTHRDRYRPRR